MKSEDGWLLAGLAFLAALAWGKRSSAAPAPSPGGGAAPEPGHAPPDGGAAPRPEEGDEMTGPRSVYERFRDIFDRYPGPMPIGALAWIAWSESRGEERAAARGNIPASGVEPRNAFVEGGILQERIAKSEDDYPHKFDFHPLTAEGAIYGRQKATDYERRGLNTILTAGGYPKIEVGTVPDAVVAFSLPHSIGTGAFRRVLALAGPAAGRTLSQALKAWSDSSTADANDPAYGSQTGVKVRARVVKALGLPRKADAVVPLPARLAPMAERGSLVPPVPVGLYATVKALVPAAGR